LKIIEIKLNIEFPDMTSLHKAASEGNIESINLLISNGADPTCRDVNGATPLHRAVCNGHEDVVKSLIKKEGMNNIKDNSGQTPMMYAMRNRHENISMDLAIHGGSLGDKNIGMRNYYVYIDNQYIADLIWFTGKLVEKLKSWKNLQDNLTYLTIALAKEGYKR
jgi:ankyrin repeat protein